MRILATGRLWPFSYPTFPLAQQSLFEPSAQIYHTGTRLKDTVVEDINRYVGWVTNYGACCRSDDPFDFHRFLMSRPETQVPHEIVNVLDSIFMTNIEAKSYSIMATPRRKSAQSSKCVNSLLLQLKIRPLHLVFFFSNERGHIITEIKPK
jgi:hypothetical protein